MTGGNFGVWGGMFSTFDCAVKGWRQKEDAWNAIISGFMTGGCLALRSELLSFGFSCISGRNAVCLMLAIVRWSSLCPWFCGRMWYSARRVRRCWSSNVTRIQRITTATDGTL